MKPNVLARLYRIAQALFLGWTLALTGGCQFNDNSPVMATGVSSDGRYVITTHREGEVRLCDLEVKSCHQVSDHGNAYSAYFIPDGHWFLWQNLDNTVHVQNPSDEERMSFNHAPVYGHVMSADMSTYVSADYDYVVRVRRQEQTQVLKHDGGSFPGYGKVLNLALSGEGRMLLSSGSSSPHADTHWPIDEQEEVGYRDLRGPTLWSLDTLEPIAKLPGNVSKTHATISPDGKWVVSGDENGNVLVWPTADPTDEQVILGASFHHGVLDWRSDLPRGHPDRWDKSKLIPAPDDATETNVAIKFIHNSQYYLRFGYRSHTAALFEVDNPWPIKYFDLGDDPLPATADYSRNLAIDTAPKANILVMGQRDGGGILVYRFDPDELTLERVWVGG